MNQEWFEMRDIRSRKLQGAVWIPVRACRKIHENGIYGYKGYEEEFFGAGSVAFPLKQKTDVENLKWADIGISHRHKGYYQHGKYVPVDIYESRGLSGVHLVLDQHINSLELEQWHLHQDFVITLGLNREGDVWVSSGEGYMEVAKLHRNPDDSPSLLEVRAEHLKDYLCARDMGLYVTSYFSRRAVVDDASFISWKNNPSSTKTKNEVWEGISREIHEGGLPYGEEIAYIHISRDINSAIDVPNISEMPSEEDTTSESWKQGSKRKKLFLIMGELWRNEWLDPAKTSPRVREDESTPTVFFITDETGRKESKETLSDAGKWLWFKPDVIVALIHRRGGALYWYTKDTGKVCCSPDYNVHFGVNKLGLINVFAKDIALLPDWQQQIWSGFNVTPEGGVSSELLASQVKAMPADTQAPEEFLKSEMERLNDFALKAVKCSVFKNHDIVPDLLKRIHRFRAIDDDGLYALAKDVTRLISDRLDINAMQSIVPPPKGTQWGSIKSLEMLLASKIAPAKAREIVAPLAGAYELRLGDAHLPKGDIEDAFALLEIDRSTCSIIQGYQLLHSCVSSIASIAEVFRRWDEL